MMETKSADSTTSHQKIAVVTGASKGIGRGIAIELAAAGYRVVVNYKGDRNGAEETARTIRALGAEALVVKADVGVKAEVSHMFDLVLNELGAPDVLVNNAARQTWKPLLDLTEEEWDDTLRTNLKGTFLCTQRAARHMVAEGRGRIINIGSGCNKVPFPNLVDYTSSKGGIEMFTRVAAFELGPHGITVNCVAPGTIETERTRAEASDYAAAWSPLTPLRRIGNPQDVAHAVAFLVSPSADFITGQTLYVDGGLFSRGPWPYEIKTAGA
ncbi:MAG: 3-oxoacyl-ACP reductase family protein [Candidatus Acidiferrales bacterium]